jgi:hypothetical protein
MFYIAYIVLHNLTHHIGASAAKHLATIVFSIVAREVLPRKHRYLIMSEIISSIHTKCIFHFYMESKNLDLNGNKNILYAVPYINTWLESNKFKILLSDHLRVSSNPFVNSTF